MCLLFIYTTAKKLLNQTVQIKQVQSNKISSPERFSTQKFKQKSFKIRNSGITTFAKARRATKLKT